MKKYLSAVILFIVIITIFQYCSRQENNKAQTLIKIGDYEVTSEEFNENLNETLEHNLSKDEACKVLLNNFLSAGILVETAKIKGYDTQSTFIEQINDYKKELYIIHNKRKRVADQKVPAGLIKLSSHFIDETFSIDYIWIPRHDKKLSIEMVKELKFASSVKNLVTYARFDEWDALGIRFYDNTSPLSCLAPQKVLKQIYKMNEGDIKRIKTGSGYHIVRLIRRMKRSSPINKENHLLALKMAIALENGDTLLEPNFLDKSIQLNKKLLTQMDFFVSPLKEKDEIDTGNTVIAELDNREITQDWIKEEIYKLPQGIQALFRNKSTRKKAIATLILMNSIPVDINNIQAEEKVLIRTFIDYELKRNNVKDTVAFLYEWIKNEFDGGKAGTAYNVLKNRAIADEEVRKHLEIRKRIEKHQEKIGKHDTLFQFNSDYSPWLYPGDFPGFDKLKMNLEIIEKMEIPNENTADDEEIIAHTANWKLSVRYFKKTLEKLTPNSRITLVKENSTEKAILYLAVHEGNIKNSEQVKINHEILDKIDLTGNSLDSVKYTVIENDVAGILGNIRINVKDLRWAMESMPLEEKIKFINSKTREDAVKDLIIKMFWQKQDSTGNIENDINFQKDLKRYENYLLAEILYANEIYIEPLEVGDEQLDCCLRKAIKILNQERLENYLSQYAKECTVEINRKLLDQTGADFSEPICPTSIYNKL